MLLNNLLLLTLVCSARALSTGTTSTASKRIRNNAVKFPLYAQNDNEYESEISSRRNMLKNVGFSFISAGTLSLTTPNKALAVDDDLTRGGVGLTPFNSLTFNYRNGDVQGGLDASTLNEPSVPYTEFLERLGKDEVVFVEFMAPDGDAAYATFKSTGDEESKPIRIGEGYPIEDHEGWSSPAFVIKAVKKKGVPYKFVVPGLAKYK